MDGITHKLNEEEINNKTCYYLRIIIKLSQEENMPVNKQLSLVFVCYGGVSTISQELFQNDKLTSKIKLGFLRNASTLRRVMQKKKKTHEQVK